MCVYVYKDAEGRPGIASLWDSLTTAGVFPPLAPLGLVAEAVYRRCDHREIRPPNFYSFYRPLVSDRSRPSLHRNLLSMASLLFAGCKQIQCNTFVLLEDRFRFKIMRITAGENERHFFSEAEAKQLNRKYSWIRANSNRNKIIINKFDVRGES